MVDIRPKDSIPPRISLATSATIWCARPSASVAARYIWSKKASTTIANAVRSALGELEEISAEDVAAGVKTCLQVWTVPDLISCYHDDSGHEQKHESYWQRRRGRRRSQSPVEKAEMSRKGLEEIRQSCSGAVGRGRDTARFTPLVNATLQPSKTSRPNLPNPKRTRSLWGANSSSSVRRLLAILVLVALRRSSGLLRQLRMSSTPGPSTFKLILTWPSEVFDGSPLAIVAAMYKV